MSRLVSRMVYLVKFCPDNGGPEKDVVVMPEKDMVDKHVSDLNETVQTHPELGLGPGYYKTVQVCMTEAV